MFKRELKQQNIKYEEEKMVENYIVDFLVMDNIVVEIAGISHKVGDEIDLQLKFKIYLLSKMGYKVKVYYFFFKSKLIDSIKSSIKDLI